MAKREVSEYRAKVTDDAGISRAKIPSPLIRELGGRPGDYMVFNYDGAGKAAVSLSRTKGAGKGVAGKAAAKSTKGQAVKGGKKR